MTAILAWLEAIVSAIPLPLLEVWGRFSYLIGLLLAICAFGGFTFRIGDRWGFGREWQRWDAKAFLSIPLTFVLVIVTGYLGSFMVLVGRPDVRVAEGSGGSADHRALRLSRTDRRAASVHALGPDRRGPAGFVLSWAEGYFFWTAFVWIAYQLIGRNPDFRQRETWRRYSLFVGLIMLLDPVMWGFICSGKFPSAFSYRNISSALFFTLAVTWLLAPRPFWPPCRLPADSDGSGRRSRGTSANARSGVATGSGKPGVRHAGAGRRRRACRSGSSSSRRSSRWCWSWWARPR